MHNDNWDDLRFVLKVAELGTVSAAARALEVNHATVLRRVSAFEEHHRVEVFHRSQQGYRLRPEALQMISAMRQVEAAVAAVRETTSGAKAGLRGLVRLTSTDSICCELLPTLVQQIHPKVPDLHLSIISTNRRLDLGQMHADVAVTPANELRENLVGERAAAMHFGVYATPDAPDMWLQSTGPLTRAVSAMMVPQNLSDSKVVATSDSFIVLREMARVGMGRSVLPCFLGDATPELARVDSGKPTAVTHLWVASHVAVADVSRFSATRRLLAEGLAQLQPVLTGA